MASKEDLNNIKESLRIGNYARTLEICDRVLATTPESFEANLYAGKASYQLERYAQAEGHYKAALKSRPGAPQPNQGLIELYTHTHESAKLATALTAVIPSVINRDKQRDYKLQLARALVDTRDIPRANLLLKELQSEPRHDEEAQTLLELRAVCQLARDKAAMDAAAAHELAAAVAASAQPLPEDERLHVCNKAVAAWADGQLAVPAHSDAVLQVVETTRPTPRWAKFHEAYLQRLIASIDAGEPGSVDRHERRVRALRFCLKLTGTAGLGVERTAGPCCTVLPFETALRLLEIEEVVSCGAPVSNVLMDRQPSEQHAHDAASISGTLSKQPSASSFPIGTVRRTISLTGAPSATTSLSGSMSNLDRLCAGMSLVRRAQPASANTSPPKDASATLATTSPRVSAFAASSVQHSATPLSSATPPAVTPIRASPWAAAHNSSPASSQVIPTGGTTSPTRRSFSSAHANLSNIYDHLGNLENERPSTGTLQLVRVASRVSRNGACEENIPICGSYELRALSRPFEDDVSPTNFGAQAHHLRSGGGDLGVNIPYPPDLTASRPDSRATSPRQPLSPQGSLDSDIFGAQSIVSADTNVSYRNIIPSLSSMRRLNRDGSISGGPAPDTGWDGVGPNADPLGLDDHGLRVGSLGSQTGAYSFSGMTPTHPRASASVWPFNDDQIETSNRLGLVEDMERVSCRLMHAYPWSAAGQVHTALALARREGMLDGHTKQKPRSRIVATLERALEHGVPTAAGWLMLAELHLKDGQAQLALKAAKAGLKYVNERKKKFHMEPMVQAGLALRLEAAWALLALGRLEEAEEAFNLLKDWTSEGDVTFAAMAGVVPASVRQQAFRGLAKVELARNNPAGAKFQYEKVLGKALRGYGPSEHWAHAEYGWLLFNEGDYVTARHHLNMAIEISSMSDVPPSERASHQFHLGRIFWALRRKFREEPEYAYTQFLEAARVEGPDQADAFAWLGHWFREVQNEDLKARKCYRRSLQLNPRQAEAGLALCDLLHLSNSESLVEELCHEVLAMYDSAAWARQRLGMHFLWTGRAQEAITELQHALRVEPNSATAWEALGAAYERMGRLNASLKTYQRVVELDPRRLYALTQAAAVLSVMGDTDQALVMLNKARAVNPTHPAVLLGIYQTYTQLSSLHASIGATNLAAQDLAKAEEAASLATRKHGTIEAAWKSLGDCLVKSASFPTATQPIVADLVELAQPPDAVVSALKTSFQSRFDKVRAARRAYAACVHLNPVRAASWSDLALTQHHEVVLMGSHPSLQDPQRAKHCSALAERVMLGALKLAPDVGGLWSALGSIDVGPAKREYALRRALQIDASDALTWLKLGRLYHSLGCNTSVKECYDNARAQDPRMAAIWEAMAAFEAKSASAGSPGVLQEATECYKHALLHTQGAGPEAALGYSYGALHDPTFPQALAFSAVHRLQPAKPLDASVYHALGLALENAGAPAGAANMLCIAAALLQSGGKFDQAASPFASILLPYRDPHGTEVDILTSVRLDWARNLCKSGKSAAAIEHYAALETEGHLARDAYALAAYARALLDASQTDAAVSMMWRAVSATSDAESAANIALSLVQASAGAAGPAAACAAAARLAPALKQLNAPPLSIAKLWLAALSAAAFAKDAAEVSTCLSELAPLVYKTHWEVRPPADSQASANPPASAAPLSAAEAAADLQLATSAFAKTGAAKLRKALAAVHVCPWSEPHRHIVAGVAAAADSSISRSTESAATRILPALVPTQADASIGGGLSAIQDLEVADAAAILAARTACTSVHTSPPSSSSMLRGVLSAAVHSMRRSVHACPHDLRPRCLLAILLTQQAVINGRAASYRRAAAMCAQLLRAVGRSSSEATQAIKSHLMFAQSSALLGCDEADKAMRVAQELLQSQQSSLCAGACYRLVARCHLKAGNVSAAEAALRHGMSNGDAASTLLLVDVLLRSARRDEAAQILNQSAAGISQMNGTDVSGGLREALQQPASAWLDALHLKHVAVLCSLGDLERAKAAFASSAMDGAHRRLAQILLGSACVSAGRAMAAASGNAKDAQHTLSESRLLLRAAAGELRPDAALAAKLVAADGDAVRGRNEDAEVLLRDAAALARLQGVDADRLTLASRDHVDAASLAFRPWVV